MLEAFTFTFSRNSNCPRKASNPTHRNTISKNKED